MNDKIFLIVGLMLIAGLLVSFICYKYYTESIIKDQDKKLSELENEKESIEKDYIDLYKENMQLKEDYARKSAELVKLKSIQPVKMQAIEIIDRQFLEHISEKDKEFFYKHLRHSLYSKFESELQKVISIDRDSALDTCYGAAYRASLELWVDTSKVNNYYDGF